MTTASDTNNQGVSKPVTAYDVAHLFNEDTTVEREIIEHLKGATLGWEWRSREYLKAYRPDES
jgi:type I restriction enzyme R subunit